jgi:hypothetical protein
MKKYLALSSLLLISNYVFAQPLAAVMTFESMTITAEGVKKQTQFQERFIRDNNTVWSERIIPTSVAHTDINAAHHENEQEHEHNLNFATAGKLLVRNPDNQIKFSFVREEDKKIIEPRTSEYGTLGFDGQWETAYYLVDRAALKKMTELKRAAPDGAKWYQKQDAHQFTRILWDEKKEIPLAIESGKLDGTSNNKITLAITPFPAKMPWNTLNGYQTIAYEDLLD